MGVSHGAGPLRKKVLAQRDALGRAVTRSMSSWNPSPGRPSGRTCSSSSLTLHSVCEGRLNGGSANLCKPKASCLPVRPCRGGLGQGVIQLAVGGLVESIYISLLIIPCIIYYVTNKRNLEATRFTQASPNQLLNSWIVSEWSHHFTGNVSCHERTLAARLSSPRMWTACNDARSDSRRRRWRASCGMRRDRG